MSPPTTDSTTLDIAPWGESVRPYADWIDRADHGTARAWARRLSSTSADEAEGAVAEAVAWDFIVHRVDWIEPGTLASGGPDFRCGIGNSEFVVEVTNIARSTVTRHTGLLEVPTGPSRYQDLTALVKNRVIGKTAQGAGLRLPYVVMVTTLHWGADICFARAHVEHLLHSHTAITGDFDSGFGEVVGPLREVTRMKLSAFTKEYSADPMRRNVSAVLMGGFGTYPDVRELGILHPDPVRPSRPPDRLANLLARDRRQEVTYAPE